MDYDRRLQAAADVNISRLDRVLDGIEDNLRSARDAVALYKKDPGKYAPQLGNVAQSLSSMATSTRVGLRTLGK